jgi:hypothetical protein
MRPRRCQCRCRCAWPRARRFELPMISIPSGVRVWLVTGHTDMRKGFGRLALLVQEALKRDPFDGNLFIFQRTSRRPDKNHLARWARCVLIHQAIGRGPLYLALCCRWRGDDQHRPNGLSHRRDRLANATKNLASTNGWISCGALTQACCLVAILSRTYAQLGS